MTTGTTGRGRASFHELMQRYPGATIEEVPGVMHAIVRAAVTTDDAPHLRDFLMKEAEFAPEWELQTLAMKFLVRKEMGESSIYVDDGMIRQVEMQSFLGLLARTNWLDRLDGRDWKTVQEFVARRLQEEAQREFAALPSLFDHATLDQAGINTCNWAVFIDKRVYRVIPTLYDLVLCRVAGPVSPAEYQSGRYLPESGLFRGDYLLRAFQASPLGLEDAGEVKKIGRDVLRMVILCGDARLERGLRNPDVGRATTLFMLVATALDEMDIRKHIESIMPIPQM